MSPRVDAPISPKPKGEMKFRLFLIAMALVGALVGAGVTFGLMLLLHVANPEGTVVESVASILVAFGTFALAYITWRSVQKTSDVINNENANHRERLAVEDAWRRISTTQGIIEQYTQALIPVTSTISMTAFNGTSQIVMYSTKLPELKELKAEFEKNPNGMDTAREQYRFILAAIPVVTNFYKTLKQMLQQELLDTRLFMNTFAKTFLRFFNAAVIVNQIVVATTEDDIQRLVPLKVQCEEYLKAVEEAQKSDAVTPP